MIKLYKPSLNELDFRRELLKDQATMAFNHAYGGTIDFKNYDSWYKKWHLSDDQHFHRYIKVDEQLVGEVAYYLEEGKWIISIIVKDEYRRRGYGTKAILLLLEECKKHGIKEVYDMIASDNPSINLFLGLGFNIIDQNSELTSIKKYLD